jgi:queuine tRNA-ribosyltransferase
MQAVQTIIPILTTEAGSCLTFANWQEVGVNTMAYYLDSLLYKPGIELLKNLGLKIYTGCTGSIILNASKLTVNKEGIFVLKSPYDGCQIKITHAELYELILLLKPNAIILPTNFINGIPKFWSVWDHSIVPFISIDELPELDIQKNFGIYYNSNQSDLSVDVLLKYSYLPTYVFGDIAIDVIKLLVNQGVLYIESDQPAALAMNGTVYTQGGLLDLTDTEFSTKFDLIDENCFCPTCSQLLTQAYLHHLLEHTPLLCQRFLIQHNMFFVKNL